MKNTRRLCESIVIANYEELAADISAMESELARLDDEWEHSYYTGYRRSIESRIYHLGVELADLKTIYKNSKAHYG